MSSESDVDSRSKKYLRSVRFRDGLLIIGIGFIVTAALYILLNDLPSPYAEFVKYSMLSVGVMGIFSIVYWYLQGAPQPPVEGEESAAVRMVRVKELIFQLEKAGQSIEIYQNIQQPISPTEKELVVSTVKSALALVKKSRETSNLDVKEEESLIETSVGREILQKRVQQLLVWMRERLSIETNLAHQDRQDVERAKDRNRQLIERLHQRLTREISQLTRRANIYLASGAFATVVAAVYLYVTSDKLSDEMLKVSHSSSSETFTILSWIPLISRISIVLAVELFAFYFLKLHREAMDGVKYYQNEITNIDLKAVGLNSAYSITEHSNLKSVVEELSKTERNFILSEKQTTVELERMKNESNSMMQMGNPPIFRAL